MKHTPGPWKIDPYTVSFAPEIITDERRIAKALYHTGSEDEEVHHNAALIAEAPDMYEALKMIADYASPATPAERVMQETARAAINRLDR